ncbi:hypothetical protein [Macrococcus capreoli]|uniref:hypothetical protein n=1 Tax=Macrococcus capreoli TaxID=2982690 RepID=UPI0021D585D4|nr:hypothetical protein [Macrococcus sp. TMW 2.2395]MCU7558431.1 hypothetical protein [Macrococcus sp. TMW 2.2395]
MEIRLLNKGYKNNSELYNDFISGNIDYNKEYFSEESIYINDIEDFPIYIAKGTDKDKLADFNEAILVLKKFVNETERDVHWNETFWHSLLISKKRKYIIDKYPSINNSIKEFNKIVIKNFDWENYIYKCVLAAEYINDANFNDVETDKHYIRLIYDNLDLYNYIIKYTIFRNSEFIIKLLTVIDEENLSTRLKAKIKNRDDLGDDERYGRRVIYELNKNYPVIMSPFLEKEELKNEIYKALALYD